MRTAGNERVTIGVIGFGTVGSVIAERATRVGFSVMHNDPRSEQSTPVPRIVEEVDAVFVAVPTPLSPGGELDCSIVRDVVRRTARARLLVITSTLYPGTFTSLQREHPSAHLAYVPEFLRTHSALADFTSPARVVIATDDEDVRVAVAQLYSTLAPSRPIVFTAPRIAEIVKLASNAFLATKVIFASELMEAAGDSWEEVANILSMDPRIGPSHLIVDGSGFGGACLPKDTVALATWLGASGSLAQLLRAVLMVNGHFVMGERSARTVARGVRNQNTDPGKINC